MTLDPPRLGAAPPAGGPLPLKVCMLGPTGAGKTSILTRWRLGEAFFPVTPTLGAGFATFELCEGAQECVWDTAGQERFGGLLPLYARDALVVLLVFDVAVFSPVELAAWAAKLADVSFAHPPRVLVVLNKADLLPEGEGRRQVDEAGADGALGALGLAAAEVWLVSAKSGLQVAALHEAVRAFLLSGLRPPPLLAAGLCSLLPGLASFSSASTQATPAARCC